MAPEGRRNADEYLYILWRPKGAETLTNIYNLYMLWRPKGAETLTNIYNFARRALKLDRRGENFTPEIKFFV